MTAHLRFRSLRMQIVVAAALLATMQAAPATQQPRTLGVSRQGDHAIEYIGMIEQVGAQFTAVGYLTHIRGLAPASLFNGAPGEATARFTFAASATIANHAQVGNTIQIGAPGQLSIYFNAGGGASFGNPASFAAGIEIAALDVRFSNVLSVIAPNLGISSGTAYGQQVTSRPFVLDGRAHRIGHRNLRHQITLFGKGVRTDPVLPSSTTEFAASSVTG